MNRSSLPAEPITLNFDPKGSQMDMGVIMVFRDNLARTLWLMIKAGHLTNQYFPEQCYKGAALIRRKKPKDIGNLFLLVRTSFDGVLSSGIEPNRAFLERLLLAVTKNKHFAYRVVLPGSSEDLRQKRIQRKRGFHHGLLGMPNKEEYMFARSYQSGYVRGARLRKRIREAPEASLRYA